MKEVVKKYFNEERFIERLHSFPCWIKDEDSLLKYIQHIHYRTEQMRAEYQYYRDTFKITEEQSKDLHDISNEFDRVYTTKLETITMENNTDSFKIYVIK